MYTPIDNLILARNVYKSFPGSVSRKVLPHDLIELDMTNFDIILAMDCLYVSYASIDCRTCRVKF